MIKNIKRFSLALVALGLSASVWAGSSCAITVPCQNRGLTVGIDLLYMQALSLTI